MGSIKKFLSDYRKAQKIDLTDEQWEKLADGVDAGSQVIIFWKGIPGEFDPIQDIGFVFELPFSNSGCYDFFVHVPNPDNPGGKDSPGPEWIHLYKLLSFDLVEKITPL